MHASKKPTICRRALTLGTRPTGHDDETPRRENRLVTSRYVVKGEIIVVIIIYLPMGFGSATLVYGGCEEKPDPLELAVMDRRLDTFAE